MLLRLKTSLFIILSAYFLYASPTYSESKLDLDIALYGWHTEHRYNSNWPVEKVASATTGVYLNDVTPQSVVDGEKSFDEYIIEIMSSENAPDIIAGVEIRSIFNELGLQGGLVNLSPLIDEYAPNLRTFFDAHPEFEKAAQAADGNIYHIPLIQDGVFSKGFFVRQDWLDRLGLSAPQNKDELYEVLRAFKTQDPNGNGKADEIPYFARTPIDVYRLATLWDAYGFSSETAASFYLDGDEVRHGFVSPNFKVAIKELAKWYSEGLFDPRGFDVDMGLREKNLVENIGGMTLDWFGSTAEYNDRLKDKIEGFQFLPMLPPMTTSGKRIAEVRRENFMNAGWAISYKNPYPVETIKYFDYWFGDEGRILSNFGVEGLSYELEDGAPMLNQSILNAEGGVLGALWAIGAQIPKGYWQDFEYERQWLNPIASEGLAQYTEHVEVPPLLPPFNFSVQEQRVYNRYMPDIRKVMLESALTWVRGEADIEEEWDGYLAEVDRLGFQEVLQVMNEAYCRQYCAQD